MSEGNEAVDITIVVSLVAVAISIIFLFAIDPGLANDQGLIQIVYIIVTGIVSILSYVTGKNTK